MYICVYWLLIWLIHKHWIPPLGMDKLCADARFAFMMIIIIILGARFLWPQMYKTQFLFPYRQ